MTEQVPESVAEALFHDLKAARRERSVMHMAREGITISMDLALGQIRLRTYDAQKETFTAEILDPQTAVRFLAPGETDAAIIDTTASELGRLIARDMAGDMAA